MKIQLHNIAVDRITKRLKGYKPRLTPRIGGKPDNPPGDFVVRGKSVAVRVARPREKDHRVTAKGKRYTYRYLMASWNLAVHGHRVRPAVWALMARGRTFVVPRQRLNGKTVNVVWKAIVDGKSWICRYEDAWTLAISNRTVV